MAGAGRRPPRAVQPDAGRGRETGICGGPWDGLCAPSMADLYPLEPERPATPAGVAPGGGVPTLFRWRPYMAQTWQVGKGSRIGACAGSPPRLAARSGGGSPGAKVELRLAESEKNNFENCVLCSPDGGFRAAWSGTFELVCLRRGSGSERPARALLALEPPAAASHATELPCGHCGRF